MTNGEALSVDLGPISEPKMSLAYDKDKGVVCTISMKVNVDPHDVARILDAGKSTSIRARIFTQPLPVLPGSEGQQLGLGAAVDPEPPGVGSNAAEKTS